jgi:hypothetical protein
MRKLVLSLISAVFVSSAGIQACAQQSVTREQARSLVYTALRLRGDKVSSKQIQETTNDVPGYYGFGAYAPKQNDLETVVGWFAVNKQTGQVWDTTSCELYEFPTLERQRRKIVHHTTKNKQEPPCEEGQRVKVVRKRTPQRSPELPEVAQ